jgi:hypothetical protein
MPKKCSGLKFVFNHKFIIDKYASIAFKASNHKYNPEEDVTKQIMNEIQEYKKGQNEVKQQITLDSCTTITADVIENFLKSQVLLFCL